jgi:hypothetical protein
MLAGEPEAAAVFENLLGMNWVVARVIGNLDRTGWEQLDSRFEQDWAEDISVRIIMDDL